ncbi:MAG: PEP-CTERM-box response regulator transcription factor [Candidatus Eisenbacteria bacterium]|uniref:PEP-CTERM-box response regulator transcription factor n=1 Tax=Eiseniibacteriota bacterium TaxID=2212470 RepID=A0A849SHZ5_UNCEI|nr:PEP-CTERM-box response regulator transcription factor [Candidatus Eisenbacteria bacterium]
MTERARILIVEDEETIRNQLRWGLSEEYEVFTAASADEARRALRDSKPSLVTLDVTLTARGTGAEDGMVLLSEIVERHPLTKVIMVTGNANRENALLAIERGAVDWYAKPIELDELRVILRRALHVQQLEAERGLPAGGARRRYHRLVGESDPMKKVFSLVQRVAGTDATVLVLGENGTGKELVAHAIHEASPRRDRPFIPINCGAIPESLMESELFGHERGAFTDAHRMREGKIELAEGGTLFLDEIGEVPVHLQVKLLRFLQERVVERIGGREQRRVDVRVVAATNRDLKHALAIGTFREDLYYRLSVVTIQVPPLRERGEDVRRLAEFFLEEFARSHKRKVRGFTQSALRSMLTHAWPGNVRELENRVQRGVILARDAYLRPEDLELDEVDAASEPSLPLQQTRDEAERGALIEALTRNAGNITRAARELDVSRPTLHDLLKKHTLDAGRFRRADASDGGEADEPDAS